MLACWGMVGVFFFLAKKYQCQGEATPGNKSKVIDYRHADSHSQLICSRSQLCRHAIIQQSCTHSCSTGSPNFYLLLFLSSHELEVPFMSSNRSSNTSVYLMTQQHHTHYCPKRPILSRQNHPCFHQSSNSPHSLQLKITPSPVYLICL